MEKINIIYKKVEDLVPYENNPRRNDDAIEYVANSIKEFGFKVPIIVDKNNIIVAGHTRLEAAKELGLKEVPCLVADDLSDKQIKAFRLADNKVGEYSKWDFDKLDLEIQDLKDFDLGDFGFSTFELDMAGEDIEPNQYDEEMLSEYDNDENENLARERVMITYEPKDKDKMAELLGLDTVDKIVYRLEELTKEGN